MNDIQHGPNDLDSGTDRARTAAPRPGGGSAWLTALGRLFRQPRFVVAALILAVSAAGLNGATQFMQLHFRKEAVPLPVKSLSDEAEGIPARLGAWVQVSKDEPLDPEIEAVLGTKQYIIREYVDTRIRPRAAAEFKDLSRHDREKKLAEIQTDYAKNANNQPQVPVLTLQMNYYTGLVDTVAHIPDRCYVADGYEPLSYDIMSVPGAGFSNGNKGARRDVPFRFIGFEDQTGRGRVGRYVGYFFQVNGEYTENPLTVRERLQSLLERYGYYCKVELMAQSIDPQRQQTPEWREAAEKAMKDLISTGLPEIEKRLPDWQRLKGKKS